jgi:hypothetical protein
MRPEQGKDGASPAPAGRSCFCRPTASRPSAPVKRRPDVAEPTDSQADPQRHSWCQDVQALVPPTHPLGWCLAARCCLVPLGSLWGIVPPARGVRR